MNTIGYKRFTCAGDETDIVFSGTPVIVYGFHLLSQDASIQLYDGEEAFIAGDPVSWFYRSGDASRITTIPNGMLFKHDVRVEGANPGNIIVFFYKKI